MREGPANSPSASQETGPITATQRSLLNSVFEEFSLNGSGIWAQYKFEFFKVSQEHRDLLLSLARAGERTQLSITSHLNPQLIESHTGEFKEMLAVHGDFSAALITLLKEDVVGRWRQLSDFAHRLEKQGGSSAPMALAHTPLGWVERDFEHLLSIRAHFGICCLPIFERLQDLYANGWTDRLSEIQSVIGLSGLGLLVRERENALDCLINNRETIEKLSTLCHYAGRDDAFVAATLHLSDALLSTHGDSLVDIAQINPAKLPEIVEKLEPEMIAKFPELVRAIARYGRSRIAPAIQALRLLTSDEKQFAEQLITSGGIFSSQAIAMRGPMLLKEDPLKHEQVLKRRGHAYWGLAEQLKENLHREEEKHSSFIDEAMRLTGMGAGQFFSSVPLRYWNQVALDFAAKYGSAAGYIARQRGAQFLDFEENPEYQHLFQQNNELFNISWANRYTRVKNQTLVTELLEGNLRNMERDPRDKRSLSLYVSAKTDPLNTFGSPSYYRLLSEIAKRSRLFIAEAENYNQITEIQRKICTDPRYGGSEESPRTIDLRILAAHSDGESLQWSGARHIPEIDGFEAVQLPEQSLSTADRKIIESWSEFDSPSSQTLLLACSTFRRTEDPYTLGPVFQQSLPNSTVHGLRYPGNLADFRLDDRGMPVQLFWRDGYVWL